MKLPGQEDRSSRSDESDKGLDVMMGRGLA